MTTKKPKEPKAPRKRSTYDPAKLRSLIEAKKTAPEIMAELGLSAVTFKAHLTKLTMQDRKFYEVPGANTRSTRPMYKKGGIKITPNMLAGLPFNEGDKFTLKVDGNNLILEKEN